MKVQFTHLWVDNFGWENTIFQQEDFKKVEVFGDSKNDGVVFMATQENDKPRILKGLIKEL